MSPQIQNPSRPKNADVDFDAVVMGAGFGGMYMLRKLRDEQGMKVKVIDKASGVGGTWYWNRYPGALSDTETYLYCYSWDQELLREWDIQTRYVEAPRILEYLEHVADRYDLRRDIELNTAVQSAHFDEARKHWKITTDTGMTCTAKYLVTALGLLSATNVPNIKGRETFAGEQYHTGNWPASIDFQGKRVGVIGTGSTGIQVITAIAPKVKHLTVFQRSPQYSVPIGNGPLPAEEEAEIKRNYARIWQDAKRSMVAFGFKESTVPAMSVSEEERRAVFQKAWEKGGGFRYMFETFGDIAVDPAANEAAASFVREKIAQIVKDPETAKKLTPRDIYAKRPLCDSGYYATYNRDNVTLVDVKGTPIDEITPTGIKLVDGTVHELDMIIFATGFDAVDGNYKKFDLRGRNGQHIKDHWAEGPSSYLGVSVAGFPNMFMVLGPNGPFTNLPPSIETQVEFIADTIATVETKGLASIEATQEAEDAWGSTCSEVAHKTLFPKAESWIFGANIPGKKNVVQFYLSGLGEYRKVIEDIVRDDHRGFRFEGAAAAVKPVAAAS